MMPCEPWPITWTCDVSCLSPTVTGSAVEAATEILWALSGRQFGQCPTKLRPCRKTCNDWYQLGWGDWMYPMPALIGGQWFNLTCGTCSSDCSCTELSEVELGYWVDSIVEVKLDGAPMVTGAYRVDDNHLLVRTDGGQWPYCQDLSLPDTEDGTWSVTVLYGLPVPETGKAAMGELACELAKAFNNEACHLPRAVTQLQRQGVTINYGDITELMSKGLTGLYLVDQFIQTWNPNRLSARASTYKVDGPQLRTVTWGAQ